MNLDHPHPRINTFPVLDVAAFPFLCTTFHVCTEFHKTFVVIVVVFVTKQQRQ